VRTDIAALYVDARGPYPKLVEQWYDETRDARTYAGPLPVVAHPPCGPWGRLRHLSRKDDPTLAPIAVEQVRRWGGVLEHPRESKLWDHCGLPRPGELPDVWGGVTVQVDQCNFGHIARKTTWLYLVGVSSLGALPSRREPTHWISGFRSTSRPRKYDRRGSAVPEGIKVCSAQQRRRTPVAFAEWLIALAATARRSADEEEVRP
jgi:hypothetical protein